MLFYVHHKGKEFKVRIESKNQKTYVRFNDGEEKLMDLSFLGNDCTFIDGEHVFGANIVGNKSEYTVWRPSGNIQLTVESEYRRIVGTMRGQDLQSETNVYSKMPGKIIKISSKVGAHVDKGEPLMVMEAMKMENEIRSNVSGEIKRICVKEGQAVEAGALLIEMEPHPAE